MATKRVRAEDAEEEPVTVRFINAQFRVPRYAARRMHRLRLLLDEHPDSEKQELDVCIDELVDAADFAEALRAAGVPQCNAAVDFVDPETALRPAVNPALDVVVNDQPTRAFCMLLINYMGMNGARGEATYMGTWNVLQPDDSTKRPAGGVMWAAVSIIPVNMASELFASGPETPDGWFFLHHGNLPRHNPMMRRSVMVPAEWWQRTPTSFIYETVWTRSDAAVAGPAMNFTSARMIQNATGLFMANPVYPSKPLDELFLRFHVAMFRDTFQCVAFVSFVPVVTDAAAAN